MSGRGIKSPPKVTPPKLSTPRKPSASVPITPMDLRTSPTSYAQATSSESHHSAFRPVEPDVTSLSSIGTTRTSNPQVFQDLDRKPSPLLRTSRSPIFSSSPEPMRVFHTIQSEQQDPQGTPSTMETGLTTITPPREEDLIINLCPSNPLDFPFWLDVNFGQVLNMDRDLMDSLILNDQYLNLQSWEEVREVAHWSPRDFLKKVGSIL